MNIKHNGSMEIQNICIIADLSMLDNWKLAMFSSVWTHDIDPRIRQDNLSAPVWVISVSLCQNIINQYNKYANRPSQDAVQN